MIEVKDLQKSYESGIVNDSISLSIPQGSIYGLLGPNGAGKTTLIRMLATITKPDSGTLLFNGEPLESKHTQHMGYMPEERGLYKKMSVWDQLLFFAEIKGVAKKQASQRAKYWLERLDILEWKNKKMEELSKGMAQKVQFLCTIIHEPKFLILDEPFSGFDPVNADLVKELVLEMNERGTTILFSTHRMDNVEELCDELAIIHQGKIVVSGKSTDIRRAQYKQTYEVGFSSNAPHEWFETHCINQRTNPEAYIIYELSCKDEKEKNTLIQQAQAHSDWVLFKENLPSIHEVFVQTVS